MTVVIAQSQLCTGNNPIAKGMLSSLAAICTVAKSAGSNALSFSASSKRICFSFSLDGCAGMSPQRKMAHLKGNFAHGFSMVNRTRYVANRVAPWERAINPSYGPSSWMKLSKSVV